jgi:hypothetical protein
MYAYVILRSGEIISEDVTHGLVTRSHVHDEELNDCHDYMVIDRQHPKQMHVLKSTNYTP